MGAKRTRSQANLDKEENPAAKKDPTPEKLYNDAARKEADKAFFAVMKQYDPASGVLSDRFYAKLASYIPEAKKVTEAYITCGIDLVLALGDREGSKKASGYDSPGENFQRFDEKFVELINYRLDLAKLAAVVPVAGYVVEPPHEEVGVAERAMCEGYREQWKKRRPDKQQYAQLDRARRDDLRDLVETRRDRREMAEDWAGNTLKDLLGAAVRIYQYGIGEHYFAKSIALLAEVKMIERPPLPKPPRELWESEW
ncbi:uncharacterized protein F4807DRAFT_466041 [Annulohypoxylon truncatum]|uniref:uncharacterized protein n=1 Tax=Annulohypoxylon truncatum TaxID=327061 RepID=UPI00200896C1|nr:uncharacterized protein F4807DRAFT_466041 [Annulohypoxylon truncatum]KAI1204078.1 hypothetical protein F4807DRAFT_466041 [Annulohypoxylon truncatum]